MIGENLISLFELSKDSTFSTNIRNAELGKVLYKAKSMQITNIHGKT